MVNLTTLYDPRRKDDVLAYKLNLPLTNTYVATLGAITNLAGDFYSTPGKTPTRFIRISRFPPNLRHRPPPRPPQFILKFLVDLKPISDRQDGKEIQDAFIEAFNTLDRKEAPDRKDNDNLLQLKQIMGVVDEEYKKVYLDKPKDPVSVFEVRKIFFNYKIFFLIILAGDRGCGQCQV